jgi:hypothetical protein
MLGLIFIQFPMQECAYVDIACSDMRIRILKMQLKVAKCPTVDYLQNLHKMLSMLMKQGGMTYNHSYTLHSPTVPTRLPLESL